jgi:hypothetical protein
LQGQVETGTIVAGIFTFATSFEIEPQGSGVICLTITYGLKTLLETGRALPRG